MALVPSIYAYGPFPKPLFGGHYMLALLLFVLFLGLILFLWRRIGQNASVGESGGGNSWREAEIPFASLRERRERLKHNKASAPVFNPLALLENAECEVCKSSPRVQFRNPDTRSTLEFCGHHASRQEKPLKAKGFTIAIDGRTP